MAERRREDMATALGRRGTGGRGGGGFLPRCVGGEGEEPARPDMVAVGQARVGALLCQYAEGEETLDKSNTALPPQEVRR
eukprot:362380-Chlamydomonas_euryale.AAC.1